MTRIRTSVRRAVRASFQGVSWQHPVVRAGLPVVDILDRLARVRCPDLRALPPYSVRIRSRGVHKQFGGKATAASSAGFLDFMREQARLQPDSQVLDIGCGCGLTALAFSGYLRPHHYTGVDIDRPSIDACRANRRLSEAGFRFIHAEVDGDVYRGGSNPASSYKFPFGGEAFSHVVMCSVVTHLLPPEVDNYFREVARMLCPGGCLVFSAFLVGDRNLAPRGLSFPHDHGHYRLAQEDLPRKAVAYRLSFLDQALAEAGLARHREPVTGSWNQDAGPKVDPQGSVQDLVLAVRA